ncbi:MAG TPA: TOBE domain-containing protein, partial [Solirubrobacteraceae bacterium]|nr:TOBE domain-containing protein [Solirubrobacteraceae bacterium]
TIYVTHDQVEAMTMGTRIAVMRKGILQQQGSPADLYGAPVNLFVASFIGSPPMNLFKARLVADNGLHWVIGNDKHRVPDEIVDAVPGLADFVGTELGVGVRPEHVLPIDGPAAGIAGTITLVENLGGSQLLHMEIVAEPVITDEVREIAADTDSAVLQTLEAEAGQQRVAIVARAATQPVYRAGDTVQLTVVNDQVHFFDLDSGKALQKNDNGRDIRGAELSQHRAEAIGNEGETR